LFWLPILLPFAVGGIIISREGLKKDIKKNLAGLGIGFGILLLILNALLLLLIFLGLLGVVVIIVIAAVVIGIYVWKFLNQKKKNKRIPR
jgi:flagellar biosynthesis component FlhA